MIGKRRELGPEFGPERSNQSTDPETSINLSILHGPPSGDRNVGRQQGPKVKQNIKNLGYPDPRPQSQAVRKLGFMGNPSWVSSLLSLGRVMSKMGTLYSSEGRAGALPQLVKCLASVHKAWGWILSSS